MKTSIEHLPAEKQEELQEIIESVRTRLPVHMIILFGSFARGNWVDHRYISPWSVAHRTPLLTKTY